ncbi:MAG: hypothetical protein ACREFH_14785, partial [Stellaceae bacterium]
MDGELDPYFSPGGETADAVARERGQTARPAVGRPKTLRWFLIVGLLLAVVLGVFYGYNRFRERAIANVFATMKPPPATISAVTAVTATVPRFASGIGSLAAVHQVTV